MAAIPALGWAAMRLPFRDTLFGVLFVAACAETSVVLGQGGAVALLAADHPEWVLSMTHLFVLTCVLSALPFALAVGIQRDLARRAAGEADTVRRVVDSAGGVAIVGTDETGRITLWNPGAQRCSATRPTRSSGGCRPRSTGRRRSSGSRRCSGSPPTTRAW